MAIHHLEFDTTLPEEGANVGAYIRGKNGDVITKTQVSGKDGLDVYVINDDLDIRDLDASQDNVAISDGTDTLEINADGSINATINNASVTVDATDLDIRDLSHTQDSVRIGDGTDLATVTDVDATHKALDVNIAASDIEIDVEDDKADTAIQTDAEVPTATTGVLVSSVLASRRFTWLYNNGSKMVYFGPSGVTAADGFPLPRGSIIEMRLGPSIPIHAITTAGYTGDVRVLQAS